MCFFAFAEAALCSDSVKNIVGQVRKHFNKINDYTCEIIFTAYGPDIYIGKTVVKIYYKKPGKVFFEAKEGFAIMPKDLISIGDPFADVADMLGSAKISRVILDGKPHFLLTVPPNSGDSSLGGKYWIDPNTFLVVKAEQPTITGGKMSSRIHYEKIQGKYWMPVKMDLIGKPGNIEPPYRVRNDTDLRVKSPKQPFKAEIIFENYIINRGIPDSVFNKNNKKE